MSFGRRHIGVVSGVLIGAFGLAMAARAGLAQSSASVRRLNPAEAAALTGGNCHDCADCETYKDICSANGTGNCTSAGASCTIDAPTTATGSGTLRKKCMSSGSLSGSCGGEGVYDCLVDGDWCQCTMEAPDWVCGRGDNLTTQITMSQDPCN
jgi:hypothetical protein